MSSESAMRRQGNFFETCRRCKTDYSCCHETTPPITGKRRKIIESFLKERKMRFKKPFMEADYVFPRLDSDGFCIFHDRRTRKCRIHPVKPETCVAGPMTFDINVRTGKIEWFIKMEKICQLAGNVGADKALLQRHLESARKEITRLVEQLGAGELKAILKKDEPETVKFAESKLSRDVLDKLS